MGPEMRRKARETSVDGLGERAGDLRVECVVAGSARVKEREDCRVGGGCLPLDGDRCWMVKGRGTFAVAHRDGETSNEQ